MDLFVLDGSGGHLTHLLFFDFPQPLVVVAAADMNHLRLAPFSVVVLKVVPVVEARLCPLF